MLKPGFALCIWSPVEGCWFSLAVSERSFVVTELGVRLARFLDVHMVVIEAASCADDHVVEAARDLAPPLEAGFVRPEACS